MSKLDLHFVVWDFSDTQEHKITAVVFDGTYNRKIELVVSTVLEGSGPPTDWYDMVKAEVQYQQSEELRGFPIF